MRTAALAGVLGVAGALGLLPGCRPSRDVTSTPAASPTPGRPTDYGAQRWGLVVLYLRDGVCRHLAGPPRIGAYRGEKITWRVYNHCGKTANVSITDLRLAPSGWSRISGAADKAQLRDAYRERATHPSRNPFEGEPTRSASVAPGERGALAWSDLTVGVGSRADVGVYTYLTLVDGRPDDDQEIEIWP
jgi:hypothetical protein